MQLLYATHFQISSHRDETITAALDRIKAQIQNWIIDWYARNGHPIRIPSGDQVIEPLPGDVISVRTEGPLANGTTQTRVIWRHGDSRNEGLVWHVTATISITQSLIEASFTVSLASASFRPLPKSLPIGRPRVVRELLANEQCSINGLPIGITPQFVGDSEISDFAENILCSPDRAIPLLLISPNVDGSLSVEPNEVADKLSGLCIVVVLRSLSATFALTSVVGRELSCFNGAIRLYWPGLSSKSNPWQHPLYLSGSVKRYEQTKAGFEGEVIASISSALSLRYVPGTVTRQAAAAFTKARREEIEGLKQRYEKGLADSKDFEGVLKLVEEERDAYKDELEDAKKRSGFLLNELETKAQELEEMKKNWVAFEEFERNTPDTPSQSEEEEGVFSNAAEAVRFAREQFGDNLEVLDSAIEAATDCPFRNPGRVYQALQAISEVALSWKASVDSKSSMGCDLVQAFKLKGFDFKKDISQTCRTKFGDDYKFSFQGDRRFFVQHITEGSGNPNSCFSVHMLFDKNLRKVVVAYVGVHRRNTTT
jgi:hypothetical protein